MAIQPSALAGQIAASRNVDRIVAGLPSQLSIDDLVMMLGRMSEDQSESPESEVLPADVVAAIVQCRLLSLMSDSFTLQAPDPGVNPSGVGLTIESGLILETPVTWQASSSATTLRPSVRLLSDEWALGP